MPPPACASTSASTTTATSTTRVGSVRMPPRMIRTVQPSLVAVANASITADATTTDVGDDDDIARATWHKTYGTVVVGTISHV